MNGFDDATLERFFMTLGDRYEVLVPLALPDGTRSLGTPGDAPLAMRGGALPAKPTAPFFPQTEELFTAAEDSFAEPPARPRPFLVAGFTPADLGCLRFVDRFFEDAILDDVYFRRRDASAVAAVSGWCGEEGAFLPPAGEGSDIEFFWTGSAWLAACRTLRGEEIARNLLPTVPVEVILGYCPAPGVDRSGDILRKASEILRRDLVPDVFWNEVADRCIACTTCNLVCPTCTCFGVEDLVHPDRVVRKRMWDSCQLDGFMREASGHNPLGTEGLRTRRRIHHKLVADPERWNEFGCFLCGRCEEACPTGIGLPSVAREIVLRFG